MPLSREGLLCRTKETRDVPLSKYERIGCRPGSGYVHRLPATGSTILGLNILI